MNFVFWFYNLYFSVSRSPLSKIHLIRNTPSLIFVGAEDERVLPEAQGISLYKAMKSQNISPTSLYHYPKEGHNIKTIESINHLLSKSVNWMHYHWKSFDELCTIEPPTTTTQDPTTTYDDGSMVSPTTTTEKPPIFSGSVPLLDFCKVAFTLLALQFCTLTAWYQQCQFWKRWCQ